MIVEIQSYMMNIFVHKENLRYVTFQDSGPGSSGSIVTDYGMEGPGSNPGGDEIFHPFSPALGPTQPPVKCVLGFAGVRAGRRVGLSHHPI